MTAQAESRVRAILPYLKVFVLCGTALGFALILEPWIEPDFSPLFLGAIALSTRQWGLRTGIVATALTIPALLMLFLPPHYDLTLQSWSVALRLISFLAVASLIVWLVHKFLTSEQKLVASLEEIRTKEERFRVALLKSPIVVFHQDVDLRYIWVYNPFPEHTVVLNKLDSDLFPPDEAAVLTRIKNGVISTGIGVRQEVKVTSRDGIRTMDLTIEPFRSSDDKIIGLLGTAVDVTERKIEEECLRESREQFRRLTAYLQAIHEDQCSMTSREIHDKVSQILAALSLELAGNARLVLEGADRSATYQGLRDLSKSLENTIRVSEGISAQLRPSLLDNLGLAAAIRSKLRQFQAHSGIAVISGPLETAKLSSDVATGAFRITEETLADIERRAAATAVRVSLTRQDTGLVLQIAENGPAIHAEEDKGPESLRLLGMKERARSFGGNLSVEVVPENGTTSWIEIPTQSQAETQEAAY